MRTAVNQAPNRDRNSKPIPIRLPMRMLQRLDELAVKNGISRSDVMRMLLQRALRADLLTESGVRAARTA